jgi:hypothetical protein
MSKVEFLKYDLDTEDDNDSFYYAVVLDKRFYAGSINKFIGDKYRFSQDEKIALEGDEMISIGKFVNELNGANDGNTESNC